MKGTTAPLREPACTYSSRSVINFGSAFASPTKPQAPRVDLDMLRQASRALSCPVCAIGGITRANADVLVEAGIDLLAVISDLFGVTDVAESARGFATLYAQSPPQIR